MQSYDIALYSVLFWFVFTIRYNTTQYNTIQYDIIQYDTIQYDIIQYDTIRSDMVVSYGVHEKSESILIIQSLLCV